jgi:cytoskeletal protein CcmA (bactofilin family)
MFSKPKDPVPAASSTTQASLAQAKRAPARSSAPSIISGDLSMTGTLISQSDIQIEGSVEGDVRSVGLVIGENARVQGEIVADDITVRGRVIGRIRARKVQLSATSHVEGDILHEAFAVEAGAFFEGNCRHSDNPLEDENLRLSGPNSAPQHQSSVQSAFQDVRTGLAGLAPLGQPAE